MVNTKLGSNPLDTKELLEMLKEVNKLEEEKSDVSQMLSGAWAEMKAKGYNIRAIKAARKWQKMEADEREEERAIFEMYENALGLFS